MAYKTKFLHFKTKASYEAERAKTTEGSEERKVFDAYISFIDEGPTICTWGKEYQCDANSLSLLPQEVTTEKQDQVFKNLGWNVHVISQSDINATTSPDAAEKTKRLEATALLVKETSLIYVRGNDDSSNHYFFKINSSSQLELIRISITTGIIYSTNSQFVDTGTIRYDRTQTLSDSNKTLARENIDAANKNDVLPLTIDLNSQTVEDYNTALEAFNSKKPLTIFNSTNLTSKFTANVIEKEATTNNINVYFSFTGINNDNTFSTIGYVGTIKPTGEKTSNLALIMPSDRDPKPLGQASPGTDTAYSRSDHVHPAQVDITGNAATATSVPWSGVTGKPTFATVATSGSYNDLTNKPTIPSLSGYATQNWVTSQGYLTSIPAATSSTYGGVKIGSNITVSSGTISLSKANVTSALGYTPANTMDIPEIPIALPNPYALTINGTSYTGSSAVSITTPKPLITTTSFTGTQLSTTINAGYSYSNTLTRTVTSLNGFSESNPDAVIISTNKISFNASNAIKMDGLEDLAGGTYYIYCLSYMANGEVAVNGAVYA